MPRQNMRHFLLWMCLAAWGGAAWAQQSTFDKVLIRFPESASDHRMVEKHLSLIFDDASKRLSGRGDSRPFDLPYDSIQKVVFDASTRSRNGVYRNLRYTLNAEATLFGTIMENKKVTDYWCYIESKSDAGLNPYLLAIDRDHAQEVRQKMLSLFANRVVVADYQQFPDYDIKQLQDSDAEYKLKPDKTNQPKPELRPDKALLVVVCPSPGPRSSGHAYQNKLHANDHVVAVNGWGMYSFAYLEPGEYTLVSQRDNARGGKMTLEAGKGYYFFQDTYLGWDHLTGLSRHSEELVMYELQGSYYANWTRTSPGQPKNPMEMRK